MARVTVEDCVERVPNRFELVLVASQRSRDITAGEQINLDRDNDKNPVVALREIADDLVAPPELLESLVRNLQKHVDIDEPEEEDMMEKLATGSLEDKPVEEPPMQKTSPFGTDLPEVPAFDDIDPSLMED